VRSIRAIKPVALRSPKLPKCLKEFDKNKAICGFLGSQSRLKCCLSCSPCWSKRPRRLCSCCASQIRSRVSVAASYAMAAYALVR